MSKASKAPLQKDEPVVTAVSIIRKDGNWQTVVFEIQGNQLISQTELSQPTTRAEAIGHFKVYAAKKMMGDV